MAVFNSGHRFRRAPYVHLSITEELRTALTITIRDHGEVGVFDSLDPLQSEILDLLKRMSAEGPLFVGNYIIEEYTSLSERTLRLHGTAAHLPPCRPATGAELLFDHLHLFEIEEAIQPHLVEYEADRMNREVLHRIVETINTKVAELLAKGKRVFLINLHYGQ